MTKISKLIKESKHKKPIELISWAWDGEPTDLEVSQYQYTRLISRRGGMDIIACWDDSYSIKDVAVFRGYWNDGVV